MKNSSRPIETNWIAITGIPSSGKTALVDTLRREHSMRTSPDYARRVLEQAKLEGHTLDDFKNNTAYYQDIIVKTRLEALYKEMPYVTVVHDYGLPCYKVWGETNHVRTLPELDRVCRLFRYKYVFLLEPLALQHDNIRIGDTTLHDNFLKKLEETYYLYGYEPIVVPRFSENKNRSNLLRAEFILEYITQKNSMTSDEDRRKQAMPVKEEA